MKTPYAPSLRALCGALLFSMAGSAFSGVSNTTPAPEAQSAPLAKPAPAVRPAPPSASGPLQQLKAEIGDAACDSVQQCSTVAVGHKACGGPEGYLAWSTKRSDGAKIAALAGAYAAQRKTADTKAGMISNCAMVMDPGATCSAGSCVTDAAGKGGLVR